MGYAASKSVMHERLSRYLHGAVPRHGATRYALEAALFLPFYLALDWASYIEPLGSFNITPWNPGPAVAIIWMMRAGLTRAPVVLAATLVADRIVRDVPGDYAAMLGALVLTGGYALISAALRALIPPQQVLSTLRSLTTFIGVVVIGTTINGVAFLGVLTTLGGLGRDILVSGWTRFWIGDVVGILVTAPLLLMAMDADKRASLAALVRRAESHAQVAMVVATLWLILSGFGLTPSKGFFLLFPPLIWIALRSGLAGALVAVTIVQLGIVIAFRQQAGTGLPIVELQALVATLTLTSLYLGIMVDERERAMEQLNQSLRLAAAGEMAGAITHEVSQPLTALTNYSRSAKLRLEATGSGDAELAVLVDKIFTESRRASQVVRRLREFFRAGSIRMESLGSDDLLELIGRLGAEIAPGSSIRFAKEAEPDLPPVWVDRLQIELALRNLIGNAVDSLLAHAPGSGEIRVSVKRDGTRQLCITVLDDGPGVPDNLKDRLFRPFATGKPTGMGLGLAVSRAIAEAHGGSLDVASAGHGEFHLILPLEAARA